MSGTTRAGIDWWTGGAGALVAALAGGVVGGIVPSVWAWYQRKVQRRGELVAIAAELAKARAALEALLTEGIFAPLYRMPTAMAEASTPKFIGEGEIGRAKMDTKTLEKAVLSFKAKNGQYPRDLQELIQEIRRIRPARASAASCSSSLSNAGLVKTCRSAPVTSPRSWGIRSGWWWSSEMM